MKKNIFIAILSTISLVANAQTDLFTINKSGAVVAKSANVDSRSILVTSFTLNELTSDDVHTTNKYSYSTKTVGYKDVLDQVNLDNNNRYIVNASTGDTYHLTVLGQDNNGQPKAILCHDHADIILVRHPTTRALSSVPVSYFGYNTLSNMLEYYAHNPVPCANPGVIYFGKELVPVTFDAIIETLYDDRYTIKTYKYSGKGWDNESEDFNRLSIFNTRTSKAVSSFYGEFKNFNNMFNTWEESLPFYQINMKDCTALIIAGKEKSKVSPHMQIVILKDGKATMVYHKKASVATIEENPNSVSLYLSTAIPEKNNNGYNNKKMDKIVFNKSTDKVTIQNEY